MTQKAKNLIPNHLNKTATSGEHKFRKLLDVANIDFISVDHHEIPKSRPQSFVVINL